MATIDPIKSTSPDTFLRNNNMAGADASSELTGNLPMKSIGTLDTLYQTKESTTIKSKVEDPQSPDATQKPPFK